MSRASLIADGVIHPLDPLSRTRVGRATTCDICVPRPELPLNAFSIALEDAGWTLYGNGELLSDSEELTPFIRFQASRARPLDKVFRCDEWIVYDVDALPPQGRAPAFRKTDNGIERGLMLRGIDPDDLRGVYVVLDNFAIDGVLHTVARDTSGIGLVRAARRMGGLDLATSTSMLNGVCRWLQTEARRQDGRLVVGQRDFVVTWRGRVTPVPPTRIRRTDVEGVGLLMELFTLVLPESHEVFARRDDVGAHARMLQARLLSPFLSNGEPIETLDEAQILLAQFQSLAGHHDEGLLLQAIRASFPEEWQEEQELVEELALFDG
jgi:hypothetical protein